jgi:phage shock protein E
LSIYPIVIMEELLANPATTVVDVRETGEFAGGHFDGAINVPLGIIPLRLDEFKAMSGPIVVYCRSGNRSGMAQMLLKQAGLTEVYNGGGLHDMLMYQN